MRVLITGLSGFVPSHFLEWFLMKTDWEIVGLMRNSRAGDLNRIENVISKNPEWRKRVNVIWHDLRDSLESVHKHIGRVDYIINMAADSHVDDSLKRRKDVFINNTLSTVNMLEYAVNYQTGLKRFIQYSTDEVFGTAHGKVSFSEDASLNPQNPYSAGKASAEMACLAWREVTGLPITITRTANMFGEMQDTEKMIPRTIGLFLDNRPATLHTFNGEYGTRQWLHAKNSADSILFILQNNLKDVRFNINGQVELNNYEIANKISLAMGIEFKYEKIDVLQLRPGYDRKYMIDDSLIKSYGWIPPLDFEKSLVETVKWSMENPLWVKLRNSQQ